MENKVTDKQKKYLIIINKVLAVLAKIAKIFVMIAIPFVVITMITFAVFVNKIDISKNQIKMDDIGFVLNIEKNNNLVVRFNDDDVQTITSSELVDNIQSVINNHSKTELLVLSEVGMIIIIVDLVLMIMILNSLEKLFKNLFKKGTPFIMENVLFIKKAAYLMLATVLLSWITGIIFELILGLDLNVSLEISNIIEVLFLFSIAYIFQYGCQIQAESQTRLYDGR